MARKAYLESGHTSKEDLKGIDTYILDSSQEKSVFVLDLSINESEKRHLKKQQLNNYLKEIGAKQVLFISDYLMWNEDYSAPMLNSEILYFPGGDASDLQINLEKENGLIEKISSFNKTIVGNSAGACVLSGYSFKTLENNKGIMRVLPGLGIIDLNVVVNYDSSLDQILIKFCEDPESFNPIYAIPDRSALRKENGKITAIDGKIYQFSYGVKETINPLEEVAKCRM